MTVRSCSFLPSLSNGMTEELPFLPSVCMYTMSSLVVSFFQLVGLYPGRFLYSSRGFTDHCVVMLVTRFSGQSRIRLLVS